LRLGDNLARWGCALATLYHNKHIAFFIKIHYIKGV